MSKQTYYFSHDFDPTGDPKMSAMIGEYGAVGYGIFWRIVEMLHADKDHSLPLKKYIYQAIAKQLLNSAKQNLVIDDLPQYVETFIKDCIEDYELFALQGDRFSSDRVFRHFEKKLKISELRSEIGKKGAIAKQNKILPESKKQNQAKEKKVKESINNIYNSNSDFVCYDSESFLLENQQAFEKICIATGKNSDEVKKELHAYHLWMEKNENYPTGKKAVLAGIESWILRSNDFKNKYNGQSVNGSKQGTSTTRVEALKKW